MGLLGFLFIVFGFGSMFFGLIGVVVSVWEFMWFDAIKNAAFIVVGFFLGLGAMDIE